MKKKFLIVNALMGLVVLFAILYQSFDAIGHLKEQLSEEHCHHVYNDHHKTEIGHAHEGSDHCFACEFTFSSFISPTKTTFTIPKVEVATQYSFFFTKEIIHSFRGSLFALRAPPGSIA